MPKAAYRIAVLALLVLLSANNVYRAATQSVVHDEALTWQMYVDGPVSNIWTYYTANDHVLNSYLERISVGFLGLSELTLRLPSLLGGLLFLWALYQLCHLVFGESLWLLLSVALVAMNPLVLDFLSAARGYGMALAFFTYALVSMLRYLAGNTENRRLYESSAALGLSVASNLTLLFPVLAAAAAFISLVPRPAPAPVKKRKQRDSPPGLARGAVAMRLFLPAMSLDWVLLSGPLSSARREQFYVGVSSLYQSVKSLVEPSLLHNPESKMIRSWISPITVVACAGIVALMIGAAIQVWRMRSKFSALDGRDKFLVLLNGTMLGTFVLLLIAHFGFDVQYPKDRTGLYWIVLLSLAAVVWTSKAPHYSVRALACFLFAIVLGGFAWQLNTHHYAVWQYNAATKQEMSILRDRHGNASAGTVRAGVSWQLEPSVNFYRTLYRMDWLAPVTRGGPSGDYDYYLLMQADRELVARLRLKPVFEDYLGGTLLASR